MKPAELFNARVEKEGEGLRLDLFMVASFTQVSRKRAKKLIDARLVRVDGRIEQMASRLLKCGEEISFSIPPAERGEAPVEGPKLELLYNLWPVAAFYKPPGLVSAPTRDSSRDNAEKQGRELLGNNLRLLHRLDRDTSGVLLFAQDERGAKAMLEAFRCREVKKVYLAVVGGNTADSFDLTDHLKEVPNSRVAIVRSGGMKAETAFRTLARNADFSLVEARPRTGRMHQIRVQLAAHGHPVVGDSLYQGAALAGEGGIIRTVERQMLHSWITGFRHPGTSAWTEVASHPPRDFMEVVKHLFNIRDFDAPSDAPVDSGP